MPQLSETRATGSEASLDRVFAEHRANLIAARQPVDNSQPLDTRKLPRVVGCKRYAKAQGMRPDHPNAREVPQRQVGTHRSRVFTFRKKPIKQANTKAWKDALKRAEIEDFRWHDLRHTWARWLVQSGTPLNVVQEMGAWESEGMVRLYAHLAPAQLAQHAEVVSNLLDGTIAAQPPKEKGLALN